MDRFRDFSHRFISCALAGVLFCLATGSHAQSQKNAEGSDSAWQQILSLDGGPKADIQSPEQFKRATFDHLKRQEQALRNFIALYPNDPHRLGALLRLSHLLAVRSELSDDAKEWNEAMKLLDSAASTASPDKQVDVAFARVSLWMRRYKPGDGQSVEPLLKQARDFQQHYPEDRRIAPMLAEIATLLDDQPGRKESLLQEAQVLAKDQGTQKRIADDLKRTGFLNHPLNLQFTSIAGKPVDLKDYRGRTVFIVFFAQWSAPSLKVIESLQAALKSTPQAAILGISLDKNREQLQTLVRSRNLNWPIQHEGEGWNNPLARNFGINSLPTVWLVDSQGVLRRLNVRGNWNEAIRKAASNSP